MNEKFIPGPTQDGLGPIDPEIREQSDEIRQTLMDAAEIREFYAEEGDHRRIMELSKSGNMRLILMEFTQAQFANGAATMNRKMSDDTTKHYTIRCWGRHLMICPGCDRIRERTWALSDTGMIYECPGWCGVVIQLLNPDLQVALLRLKHRWREIGLIT